MSHLIIQNPHPMDIAKPQETIPVKGNRQPILNLVRQSHRGVMKSILF